MGIIVLYGSLNFVIAVQIDFYHKCNNTSKHRSNKKQTTTLQVQMNIVISHQSLVIVMCLIKRSCISMFLQTDSQTCYSEFQLNYLPTSINKPLKQCLQLLVMLLCTPTHQFRGKQHSIYNLSLIHISDPRDRTRSRMPSSA